MAGEKPSFLTTLPGLLTGIAAIVTASVTAYTLIGKSRETAAVDASRTAAVNAAEAALASPAPATQSTSPPAEPPAPAPQPQAGAPFSVTAVVDDPDGYANVRAGPSTQSRIVAQVRLNETIQTHPQSTAWWLVRTQSGAQGYIHASRIRMIDG